VTQSQQFFKNLIKKK